MTNAKIQRAFANLIAPNQSISPQNPGMLNNLQATERARDIADWLIGNNLTVAAIKKFDSYEELLSVGRVQTPTLALVVEREKAIRDFMKSPFWRLIGNFTTPDGKNFEAENMQTENLTSRRMHKRCLLNAAIIRESSKNWR